MDVIEFAVLDSPQDILEGVAAPSEIGGTEGGEESVPMGAEIGVFGFGSGPAAGDAIAEEVVRDATGFCAFNEFLVGELGGFVGALYGIHRVPAADFNVSSRVRGLTSSPLAMDWSHCQLRSLNGFC